MAAGGFRTGIVLVALALVAGACSDGGVSSPPSPGSPAASAEAASAAPPCTPAASLEERAGRVLVVGMRETMYAEDPIVAELLDVGVGGILLTHANVESRPQVEALVAAFRGAGRPMLIAADEEPGRVRTFEALWGFIPSARRMASEWTVEEVWQEARLTGSRMAAMGVTINMAPVADLDAGSWDGIIGDRSFSADPAHASAYTLAYARGLKEAGVIPVVKHFPGHGRATDDSHVVAPEVTTPLPELRTTDLVPFSEAVSAGAPVVMMGHVAYSDLEPGIPASVSPAAYKLLRGMGFKGAAITDSVGMGAVNLRWDFDEAAVVTVAAGADGVLATDGWQARRMRDALVTAVQSGRLPEARLNEAAGRMLALAGGDPQPASCTKVDLPVLR